MQALSAWFDVMEAGLRLKHLPYEVLYESGMFFGMFRFAKKIKILIKGEIRCI